jgi:ribonuclease VapC
MIAVDSSALLAILFAEADASWFARLLLAEHAVMSAPTLLEARTVVIRRKAPLDELGLLIATVGVEIRPFELALCDIASDAYARFGKGQGRARLNYGDCFSYALAKALDIPLLYKGDDFAQTDIRSALA